MFMLIVAKLLKLVFNLFCIGALGFCVYFLITYYKQREERQAGADENVQRNGGKRKLEWAGEKATGPADHEFGELVVEVQRLKGGAPARFYEYGLAVKDRRVNYLDLKDVNAMEDTRTGGLNTAKSTVRDCGKLEIFLQKGSMVRLWTTEYILPYETMLLIKTGLGYEEN